MVLTRSQRRNQQLEEQADAAADAAPPAAPSHRLASRLVLLAAGVRAAYLLLVLGFAHLLADFDTSASLLSESCADGWPEEAAAAQRYLPGVVWDSVFLHRVAACGYEYEQFYAFYPGVPGLVWLVRKTGLLRGQWGFAATVLAINNACFLASVWLLTKLGERFVGQDRRVVATAVLFFIASPASIHHSMLYTEALFTTASWLGLYCLYCKGSSLAASLAFAASCAMRSNGLLNAGFVLHEHGRRVIEGLSKRQWASALKNVATAVLCTVISVAPYFAYMLLSYRQFCTGVWEQAGPFEPRPWCSQAIPSAYGYVQRVYWHVGFLRYYTANQIPNFFLAGPTLAISLWGALAYAAASPHVLLTGGLLTRQQLQRWFGSGGSSKGGSGSGSSRWLAVIVGAAEYCSSGSSSGGGGGLEARPAVVKGPYQLAPQRLLHSQQRGSSAAADEQQEQQGAADQAAAAAADRPPGTANGHSTTKTQQQQQQQQQQRGSCCGCASNVGYYRPELAVFVVHWLVLTLVCLAVVHIQVATRFLSSCAPLYWFAALLMLHKGRVLRWLLCWYCLAYMGVGAVMFINFYPWV